jgi:hypothetical protein
MGAFRKCIKICSFSDFILKQKTKLQQKQAKKSLKKIMKNLDVKKSRLIEKEPNQQQETKEVQGDQNLTKEEQDLLVEEPHQQQKEEEESQKLFVEEGDLVAPPRLFLLEEEPGEIQVPQPPQEEYCDVSRRILKEQRRQQQIQASQEEMFQKNLLHQDVLR